MADIHVYKLQLVDDSFNDLLSQYPLHNQQDLKRLISEFNKNSICIKENSEIILPNGKILLNGKEIFDYYLAPGKKRPKNFKVLDNILKSSTVKVTENDKFKWINI